MSRHFIVPIILKTQNEKKVGNFREKSVISTYKTKEMTLVAIFSTLKNFFFKP
jgi:hypothetical protein